MYAWIRDHIDFKPFYVFGSWLLDCKPCFATPDPWIGGNGYLWTYCIVPVLMLALIMTLLKVHTFRKFHPPVLILVFLVLLYYFLDASIATRFIFGFNLFIMAWALSWIVQQARNWRWTFAVPVKLFFGSVFLVLAWLSYFQGLKGHLLERKVVSIIQGLYDAYPVVTFPGKYQEEYCTTLVNKLMNKKEIPANIPQKELQKIVEHCQVGNYRQITDMQEFY
ncbi:MAG: hypothetical protein HQL18_02340 [Candidatus Omnitrophica bacterium]|nr:hypothetical protein [Candidatus Omnitrophota bacterium]